MSLISIIPYFVTAAFSVFLVWYFSRCDLKKIDPKGLNILEWVIVSLGLANRLVFYLYNYPIKKGFARIFTIQYYSSWQLFNLGKNIRSNVHDPFGILVIQKIFISLFGSSEYAVRLFVFLCSLASIFLFKHVKAWFCTRRAGIIALILFCFSHNLIVYAITLNAYSSDVLVALLLIVMARRMRCSALNISESFIFGLLGALSLWFSYPAAFVLGGIFMALSIEAAFEKKAKRIYLYGFIAGFWLTNFLFNYFYRVAYFAEQLEDSVTWSDKFLPLKEGFPSVFIWFVTHFYRMFVNPMGLFPVIGMFLFFLGIRSMVKTKKFQLMLLLFPFILVLIASAFNKYPFGGRVLIFLIPASCLLMGEGWDGFFTKGKRLYKYVLSAIVLFLLLVSPVSQVYSKVFMSAVDDPMAISLKKIKNNYQEGDLIYVHTELARKFLYYNNRFTFNSTQYMFAQECIPSVCPDLEKLKRYKRIWFIANLRGRGDLTYIQSQLSIISKTIDEDGKEDGLYLYEVGSDIKE